MEPGEEPEATVIRELREETGYMPSEVVKLGGFYSSPGFNTEYLHLYLATGLEPNPLRAEDTDSIRLIRVPLEGIRELIVSGKIIDVKSIAGLLVYLDYRESRS